jgi:hypothetical protein
VSAQLAAVSPSRGGLEVSNPAQDEAIVLDEKVHFSKLDAVKRIRIRREAFHPARFFASSGPAIAQT